MDCEELALIAKTKENPKDWLPLQVYADWLDDHTTNDALTAAVLTFVENQHNLRQSNALAQTR